MTTTRNYHRDGVGQYRSDDGIVIHRVPDVNPPAWNAYRPNADGTDTPLVDGAATYRDARAIVDATTNHA
jgi:hypothetical protein